MPPLYSTALFEEMQHIFLSLLALLRFGVFSEESLLVVGCGDIGCSRSMSVVIGQAWTDDTGCSGGMDVLIVVRAWTGDIGCPDSMDASIVRAWMGRHCMLLLPPQKAGAKPSNSEVGAACLITSPRKPMVNPKKLETRLRTTSD